MDRRTPQRSLPTTPAQTRAEFAAYLLAVALVLVPALALATSEALLKRAQHPDRPVSIFEADRTIDRVIDGERVTYLLGHVFIDRDSLTARSDTAVYYRDRDFYEFHGNVEFTRLGGVLDCLYATYDRVTGAGDFFRNVRMVEGATIGTGERGASRRHGERVFLYDNALLVAPDYTVRADTIARNRVTGVGQAFGHVRIMEPEAKNLVTGDHAIFFGDGGTAEVDRRPVLVSREQEGGPLRSTAGLMRFHRDEDKVVMIDSVRITQGTTLAVGDTAVAYGRERMVLTGTPRVSMNTSSTMEGDEIEFIYTDGELRRVILMGNARMEDSTPDSLAAIYKGLPRMDVLEGDSISVAFRDEEIHRTVVVGSARSQYTPTDLNEEVATNDVYGDTIVIDFRNERVNKVNVMGNMTGTYQFARVAAMREMLGRSRRLADMLARTAADSAASDSLLADGDAAAGLTRAGRDSLRAAVRDSLVLVQVDSLALAAGLPPPSRLPGGQALAAGTVDSLLSAALDSLAAAGFDTSAAGLDFLANAEAVKYSGGSVLFELADKTIDIRHDGQLDYGTMKLTADHIKLDTVDRELYAEGDPVVDDSETIVGERMGYNFRHRTGAVAEGVTSFDEYYYVGDEIKRFADTTLKICNGKMTSCDLAEPHYHFWSSRMKIRMGDKVVAKPIVLRIGRVPIFALPFYFKNLQEGRRSGILFPNFDFGWSSREGRYIRDFGYYWATNDYTDFIFEGDYNERSELGYRVSNRYVKRYAFNGGVDYSRRIGLGDSQLSEWQLRWNHNQPTLFDDYKFRADVRLASQTLRNNDLSSTSERDIVSGQMKSNIYLSRSWTLMSANLSANRDERVNAGDDDPTTDNLIYSMTLPSLSVSFRQFALASPAGAGQRAGLGRTLLSNTYFKQSYSFTSKRTGYEVSDVADYAASGSWSLTHQPPRLGIFNVSFSANGGQNWSRTTTDGRQYVADTDSTGHYETLDEWEESTRPSLSFGANVGTTLYGLFPVKLGRLQAIRHTLQARCGWSLRPGLGSKQAHGTSYTFSLGNRFDVKYLSSEGDSTLTEKKLDGLVDWSLSTSYNPKAEPDSRWGDISSGLTVKPGQASYLRLKVSNSIDPRTLSLKSTRFSYSLNFQGKLDLGAVAAVPEARRNDAIDRLGLQPGGAAADSTRGPGGEGVAPDDPLGADEDFLAESDRFFEGEDDAFYDFYDQPAAEQHGDTRDRTEGGRFLPFNVSASISYSYTNASQTKRANGNFSVGANLTRNWEVSYNTSFDLVEGSPVRQQFNLSRDLHCWKLEFNRTISTVDSQFGFRIYLKSIPSLKVTRGREDGMSSLAGSLSSGYNY